MALPASIMEFLPDPENPGWRICDFKDKAQFNAAVLGPLLARLDADGSARLRMFPARRHENVVGNVHGGVTMALIDVSLFMAMHMTGAGSEGGAATLEVSTQFIGKGTCDLPLDAVAEIVRETGSLVFVRGKVEQEGSPVVAGFSGIIRKFGAKPAAA